MDYYNNETILTQAREIESLRQQLAAALAACESKDTALRVCESTITHRFGKCHELSKTQSALAIQPESFSGKHRAQVFNNELAKCAAAIRELKGKL